MNEEYVLKAPYMPELDKLPMDAVCDYLELHVSKYGINCVNWKDRFPYHPIAIFQLLAVKNTCMSIISYGAIICEL